LDDNVVFITGAAGGIGRATAAAFAGHGAHVGLIDRNRDGLAMAAEQLRAHGSKVETVVADLAAPGGVRDSVGMLLDAYGRVDVLVNAVGVLELRGFDELTWDDWLAGFRVHFLAAAEASRLVLGPMRQQHSGTILFVGSDLARQPEGIAPHYEVAKAALGPLVKMLARTEGPRGIRVNAVAPGPVDTSMLDGLKARVAKETGLPPEEAIRAELRRRGQALDGRLGRPEEIAAALVFLASHEASYITGATLSVDGGTTRGLP